MASSGRIRMPHTGSLSSASAMAVVPFSPMPILLCVSELSKALLQPPDRPDELRMTPGQGRYRQRGPVVWMDLFGQHARGLGACRDPVEVDPCACQLLDGRCHLDRILRQPERTDDPRVPGDSAIASGALIRVARIPGAATDRGG